MKYFVASLLLFITSVSFIFPRLSYAHVLLTDGTIGAVVHIDPDDDPVVGLPSTFFFQFKDKENKFTPQLCDCQVTIYQAAKQVYSQPLFQNTDQGQPTINDATFTYTFPERDIYTLKVIGKPLTPDGFTPFTLSYDIRISRDNSSKPLGSQNFFTDTLIYIVGGVVVGIIIVGSIIELLYDRKKLKEK